MNKTERLSGLLQTEWREPTRAYKMSSRAYVGMPPEMKEALRHAAEVLSAREQRRVSMSEVMRRLAAAGGLR